MDKKKHENEITQSFHEKVNWERQKEFEQTMRSRRGFQRKIVFIIDMSTASKKTDYKPDRISFIKNQLAIFFKEFYINNPLSEISLITTKKETTQQQFPLSRNLIKQKEMEWGECDGGISIQNSLQLAHQILKNTSESSSREIIIVTSSISTCDPGNVYDTMQDVSQSRIKCSVMSLEPEMFVLKTLTKITGGEYHTIMNEVNFKDVLYRFIEPPIFKYELTEPKTNQLYIAFPKEKKTMTICECHKQFKTNHYECPNCGFCYCELPIQCKVCNATLLYSHHFARSYHFMFPVKPFEYHCVEYQLEKSETTQRTRQIQIPENDAVLTCSGCQQIIPILNKELANDVATKEYYICTECNNLYCVECDSYIHDVLYNCPGCENKHGCKE